jgi:hypothetical protein
MTNLAFPQWVRQFSVRLLVLEGDTDLSVLEICGEPLHKTKIKVTCPGIDNGCYISCWAYRKEGKHDSMVYISDGQVIKVKTEAK